MNAYSEILRTYAARSWIGTFSFVGTYLTFTFLYFHEGGGIDPLFLTTYIVVGIVSSRLRSLSTYSLSFNLPRYRRRQLVTGAALILVFGWLPTMVLSYLYHDFIDAMAFLTIVTGTLLLGDYRAPRVLAFGTITIVTCLIIFLFMGLTFRWTPGEPHATLLIVGGALLLAVFLRAFQAGDEYGAGVGMVTGIGWYGNQWVRLDEGNQIHAGVLGHWIGSPLDRFVDGYRSAGKVPREFARMIDLGTGDWSLWASARLATLLFGSGLAVTLLLFAPPEAWLDLPWILTCLVFIMLTVWVMFYVTGSPWPLHEIWIRTPVQDKDALLKLLCTNKARNVGQNYLAAATVGGLLAIVRWCNIFSVISI